MIEIHQTDVFAKWFAELSDEQLQAKVLVRLRRLSLGNAGDAKAVGGGVHELRIDYGPGYRIYYAAHGKTVVILLCGGDKRSQQRDIRTARSLAKSWKNRR